jgi:hypothetical protein
MDRSDEHLRLLSIFHYVVAGMAALFSMFPVIHLVMGVIFLVAPPSNAQDALPLAFVGWFFVIFASFFILCGLTFATCLVLAGRNLARRRRYLFCLVMACVACMFVPFGTVLGVFTILVLMRPGVRGRFAGEVDEPVGD